MPCPTCGAVRTAEAIKRGDPCPACFLAVGLDEADSTDLDVFGALPVELPEAIGRYKILRVLGEGGMGMVYLAEQKEPVRRRVALKVIKLGMDTREVIARFEIERQALAVLTHPGVARVLDAGVTDDGRPYFVMEYVDGQPISEYANRRRLGITARLDLFMDACDAIQHAHQKGIIHRDLKPSNLLVTDQGGRPQVKVIDFGVAKAMDRRLTDQTLQTQMGLVIGTPEYMSPEQAGGGAGAVDTRTDIYSLGVLLYELLVGVLPFDGEDLRKRSLDDMLRTLREREPQRPSARYELLEDEEAHEVAASRGTDPAHLVRRVRGELDWITMRALEKDPARRFASAAELRADVLRHLKDEPVLAGPPSMTYRLWKMTRRYRVAVIAGAVVAASLLGSAVASTSLLLREQRARSEAETQRTEAEWQSYVANLKSADTALRFREWPDAREQLERSPEDRRGWEWRHLALVYDSSARRARLASGQIKNLSVSPDQRFLRVLSADTYELLDLESLAVERALPIDGAREGFENYPLAVSPDGHRTAVALWPVPVADTRRARARQLLRGGGGVTLLPTTRSGSAVALGTGERAIEHATWSTDGRLLATYPVAADLAFDDRGGAPIRVFDAEGREQMSLEFERAARGFFEAPGRAGRPLDFFPDGRFLAAGGWSGVVAIWRLSDGRRLEHQGHEARVSALAVDPTGTLILTGAVDGTVKLWRASGFDLLGSLTSHRGPVAGVAFGENGATTLSIGEDGVMHVGETTSRLHLTSLPGPSPSSVPLISMASDLDGRLFAASAREVTVWEAGALGADRSLGRLAGVTQLALDPEGQWIAAATVDQRVVVYQAKNGQLQTSWKVPAPGVRHLTMRADGRLLAATIGADRSAGMVATDNTTWRGRVLFWTTALGRTQEPLVAHEQDITALRFARTSPLLATASRDGALRLWSTESMTPAGTLNTGPATTSLLFGPGDAFYAAGLADGSVLLFELDADAPSRTLETGLERPVEVLDISEDGRFLAAGTSVGGVLIDLETGEVLRGDFGGPLLSLNHDGTRLVTIAGPSLKVWSTARVEALLTLRPPEDTTVSTARFSRDGHVLVAGTSQGARWWRGTPRPPEAGFGLAPVAHEAGTQ